MAKITSALEIKNGVSAVQNMLDLTDRIEHLIPADRIAEFSRRWQVRELALFGSVLRDDFSPASDIDVLISFAAQAK